MNNITRILIVEDLPPDYELAQREIRKTLKQCKFERAVKQRDFLRALEDFQPDLIVSDYVLPDFDGMKVLKLVQKHSPSTPVIIWTGAMGESVVVECLKQGAANYVIKDDTQRLGLTVRRALEERWLALESRRVEEKYRLIFENAMEGIFQTTPDGRYLSVNPAMAQIYGYSSTAEVVSWDIRIIYPTPISCKERASLTMVFIGRLTAVPLISGMAQKAQGRRQPSAIFR